jgi:hypothetical protein
VAHCDENRELACPEIRTLLLCRKNEFIMYCFSCVNSVRLNSIYDNFLLLFMCRVHKITHKTSACADNKEFRVCGDGETMIDVVMFLQTITDYSEDSFATPSTCYIVISHKR